KARLNAAAIMPVVIPPPPPIVLKGLYIQALNPFKARFLILFHVFLSLPRSYPRLPSIGQTGFRAVPV
ncbi:MAG: hypothetical protein LBB48_01730, partial [Treponema sp.]|nr:hypothetical protein [Treponema sp.]